MDTSFIIIGLLVVVIIVLLVRRSKPESDTGLRLILDQMNEMNRLLDSKMSETTRSVSESLRHQLGESATLVREVTKSLVKLEETNKQVISFSDQLQSLQDILKNPKQRGVLGEYYLETLLKNILPPGHYKMQYAFGNGEIVDAVVFVKDKIIPIDSKFSLENYNRLVESKDPAEKERLSKGFVTDLKNRIVETSKYIRPEEGTMDFAFMFIPHEAIYYDLLVGSIGFGDDNNLIQKAAGTYKVIIVSPTSFLAYLQTVLQGLKAMQIEEQAKDIIKRVDELGKHLKKYEEYHGKLGNALQTTVNHFNASSKEFRKIDKDMVRIGLESPVLEASLLDSDVREE